MTGMMHGICDSFDGLIYKKNITYTKYSPNAICYIITIPTQEKSTTANCHRTLNSHFRFFPLSSNSTSSRLCGRNDPAILSTSFTSHPNPTLSIIFRYTPCTPFRDFQAAPVPSMCAGKQCEVVIILVRFLRFRR